MAVQPICKIEGCGKPSRAYGWCNSHYGRWCRHGNAVAGGTAWGEPERFLREVVLPYQGTACLTWPFAKTAGYGVIWREAKLHVVSRLVCEERHGPAPTPEHEAAHSCGRGDHACVTGCHLDWKTPKQNKADELLHGTRNRGARNGQAKLTEVEARKILALKGQQTQRAIAAQFGVSHTAVGDIHRGERWPWL